MRNSEDYGNAAESFTTGTSSFDHEGKIYIQKEATGRISRFNVDDWNLQSFAATPLAQGATVAGNKMMMLPFDDGAVRLNFLYTQRHTGNELFRMLVI